MFKRANDLSLKVFIGSMLWFQSTLAEAASTSNISSRLGSLNKEFTTAGAFLVGLFALVGLGLMGIGGMGLYKFFKTEGGGQGQSIKGPLSAFVIGVILLGLSVFKGLVSTSILGSSAPSTNFITTGNLGGNQITGF